MTSRFWRRPEDKDGRLAFLEDWASSQQSRLAEDEQRLAAEERRRLWADEIAHVVAQARQRFRQVDGMREATVIPVVITKPSVLPADRAALFGELTARLREYRWADPIVSECDEPWGIAPKAIDLARRHRPGAPWLLYMEDDVILGPDFGLLPGLLSEADELFPHSGMVNFFSMWIDEPGWSIQPMHEFRSTLCVAIRNTDYLSGFRSFVDSVVTEGAGTQPTTSRTGHDSPNSQGTRRPTRSREIDMSDHALGSFLAPEYDAFALWCPSLVQHAEVVSVFLGQPKNWPERISKSYEQAYG